MGMKYPSSANKSRGVTGFHTHDHMCHYAESGASTENCKGKEGKKENPISAIVILEGLPEKELLELSVKE